MIRSHSFVWTSLISFFPAYLDTISYFLQKLCSFCDKLMQTVINAIVEIRSKVTEIL